MSPLDLKGAVFYSPEQVAVLFGKDLRFVYRHSAPGGFLQPYARRFKGAGKRPQLFFVRTGIDGLTGEIP